MATRRLDDWKKAIFCRKIEKNSKKFEKNVINAFQTLKLW
jgi:hypothetical protein